mmetsp:Transcript_27995/g.88943  ORF Transcript_27995/g.88943 Transcript_27995/m.88943 type:complete len:246 (+) Transcript_27995:1026-1763(+)
MLQVADILVGKVQHTAGGCHHDVHVVVEAHDVLSEARAAGRDHALHVHVLSELLHHRGGLQGKLAGGHQDEALDGALGGGALLEQGDNKGARLAGAVLRAGQHRLAGQGHGDAVLLDRRGLLVALLEDAHEELPLEEVVLEVVALGRRHVLRLHAVVGRRPRDLGLPVVVRPYLLGRLLRRGLASRDGGRVRADLRVGAQRRRAAGGAALVPVLPAPLAALGVAHRPRSGLGPPGADPWSRRGTG